MNPTKFQIDRPDISDEQALRHKNFDAVLQNHAVMVKPGIKPWHFWAGGTAIVAGIVTTVVLMTSGPDTPENQFTVVPETDSPTTTAVVPPLEGVDVPYQYFTFEAGEPQEITTPSGSVIMVPADGIVDAHGNPVDGEVELSYREFHDAADFFVSGIPMVYDSAGMKMHFESAGMFEILGNQEGVPVYVNPDSPLQVDLTSYQPGSQFNIYKLNAETGEWSFITKDTAGKIDVAAAEAEVDALLADHTPEEVENKLNASLDKLQQEVQDLNNNTPVMPVKANKDLFNLSISVDEKEFPEIAAYRDVVFEITEENENFDPEMVNINWDDVALSKEGDQYLLTFVKSTREETFITRPVLVGKSYDDAEAAFAAKFAASNELLAQKQEAIEERQKQLEYLYLQNDRIRQNANDMAEARRRAQARANGTEGIVKRAFTVTGFGIWNSDCPLNLPQGRMFAAKFVKKDKEDFEFSLPNVFLVERGKNAMYTMYEDIYGEFTYNPESDNVMWGVDDANRLVMYSTEDFEDFDKNYQPTDSVNFTMQIVDRKITKVEEVRELMGI